MHQWIESALVKIMACRLFGAKPLSKPVLSFLWIGHLGTNICEILIKMQNFLFAKKLLKMSSAKWRTFWTGGDELINFLYCGIICHLSFFILRTITVENIVIWISSMDHCWYWVGDIFNNVITGLWSQGCACCGLMTLWRQDTWSTLVRVVVCLVAPRPYLDQKMTNRQWHPASATWEQFHRECSRLLSLIHKFESYEVYKYELLSTQETIVSRS